VIAGLGPDDESGQRFGVLKVLDEPEDPQAIHLQWYDAKKEFGNYEPMLREKGKPRDIWLPADAIATKGFVLEQGGQIPKAMAEHVASVAQELASLETGPDAGEHPPAWPPES
jgi:hypothetical protein